MQTILSKYVEAENSGIGKSDVFGDSHKDKCIENSYLCSPVHPLRGRLLFVSPAWLAWDIKVIAESIS